MSDPELRHLLGKARDAARGGDRAWHVMSTGEKLGVALVLNRADWLHEMGYTIAEAMYRCSEWVPLIPLVETALRNEDLLPMNAG